MRSKRMRLQFWSPDGGRAGGTVEPDDRDLVQIYQHDPDGPAGRAAGARLLARYRRRVLAWCWRLVQDREQALDLAQEVLLNVWSNLGAYDERGQFGAWVFMVTRNRCLSELRRRKVPVAEAAVLDMVADHAPRPDEVLERKLLGEEVEQLVRDNLTVLEQDALWLRCYEGLSVEVITRRLGITEKTGARAVLQRARRKLRAVLVADAGGTS